MYVNMPAAEFDEGGEGAGVLLLAISKVLGRRTTRMRPWKLDSNAMKIDGVNFALDAAMHRNRGNASNAHKPGPASVVRWTNS